MNEGLNFFMHREYVRSELKDDQTCEPMLPITVAASGFVQPAPCSQQPPTLLFSAALGDSLLPDFVGAWLSGGCG